VALEAVRGGHAALRTGRKREWLQQGLRPSSVCWLASDSTHDKVVFARTVAEGLSAAFVLVCQTAQMTRW
jgi:hypothetical protein